MTVAEPAKAPAGPLDVLELPMVWGTLWSEFVGAALTTSISFWTTLSRVGAGVMGQAVDLERIEALAAVDGLDRTMRDELHVLEEGAEQLTHVGETAIAGAAGGPIFSLPD